MTSHHRQYLPALLLYALLYTSFAERVPVRYKIDSRQTECMYQNLIANDVVTFSVFVIEASNNGKPRASISFEGPVAGNTEILPRGPDHDMEDDNSNNPDGLESAPNRKETTGRTIRKGLLSEWSKINGAHAPHGVLERKFKVDWTHAGESEDAEAARTQLLEKVHEEFRQHSLEQKRIQLEKSDGATEEEVALPPPPLHTIAQSHIGPYEETQEIAIHGWYRLCVTSDFMPLVVEMDMRTSNEMKGIHPGTGHVYTYEQREYLDEKELLTGMEEGQSFYNTKDGHKEIKVDDLKEAKIKLNYMHDLTSEIMKSQHTRMHRIRAHDADARRGAAALAWSSKFETLLYVIIMGVQVYTVHRWLLNSGLGK